MAREEHDREDLLRDATAFVERIEFEPNQSAVDGKDHIFVGFHRDGAASFYFGADPVYHFNSRRQLRRAFRDSLLFKAEHGQLVSLQRVRQDGEVQLQRNELSDKQTEPVLADAQHRLRELKLACEQGTLTIVGQVPRNADVLARVALWLDQLRDLQIARTPHAR